MDLRRINLNLLVALDVLVAERSVTKAAARLNLSQPGMSYMLNQLREVFGDPLLVRTSGGMRPTHRAIRLVDPVRRLLAEVSELVEPASFDPATSDAVFSIAVPDVVELMLLPSILETVRSEAPNVRLNFREINADLLGKQVANGDIDLCITIKSNVPLLRSEELYWENPVWVVRKGHPIARSGLAGTALADLDHVELPSQMSEQATKAMAAVGQTRRVILSVPHYLMLPEVVSRSEMIALLPSRMAAWYPDVLVSLESPISLQSFPVHLCWDEATDTDPARQWLRALIKKVCSQSQENASMPEVRTNRSEKSTRRSTRLQMARTACRARV